MNSASDEKLVKTSYNSTKSIATLTLNRPKAYNALNRPLFEVLRNELIRLDNENGVKVIVLTGEGKVFCGKFCPTFMLSLPSTFSLNVYLVFPSAVLIADSLAIRNMDAMLRFVHFCILLTVKN